MPKLAQHKNNFNNNTEIKKIRNNFCFLFVSGNIQTHTDEIINNNSRNNILKNLLLLKL